MNFFIDIIFFKLPALIFLVLFIKIKFHLYSEKQLKLRIVILNTMWFLIISRVLQRTEFSNFSTISEIACIFLLTNLSLAILFMGLEKNLNNSLHLTFDKFNEKNYIGSLKKLPNTLKYLFVAIILIIIIFVASVIHKYYGNHSGEGNPFTTAISNTTAYSMILNYEKLFEFFLIYSFLFFSKINQHTKTFKIQYGIMLIIMMLLLFASTLPFYKAL